jgi:trehalose 6-phosphate synthase/phosphatase
MENMSDMELIIASNRGPFSFSEDFLNKTEKALKDDQQLPEINLGQGGLVQAMSGLLKKNGTIPTWISASMGNKDSEVGKGYFSELFEKINKRGYSTESFPFIEVKENIDKDEPGKIHFVFKDYDFFIRNVSIEKKPMKRYYDNFCNGPIWNLMHQTKFGLFKEYRKGKKLIKSKYGFPNIDIDDNDGLHYTAINLSFADNLLDECKINKNLLENGKEIVIWLQDYHLLRASEMFKDVLRKDDNLSNEERNRIHIGQFIHTPFFDIDAINNVLIYDKIKKMNDYRNENKTIEETLKKLTRGMLGNDFIGFHTKEYVENFVKAIERFFPATIKDEGGGFYKVLLKNQKAITRVGHYPIGLDINNVLEEVKPEKKLDYKIDGTNLSELISKFKKEGKIIFGGMERDDYTKGLPERVQIYGNVYRQLKSIGKDSRLIQVTSPSRLGNEDYREHADNLKKDINRINRNNKNSIIHYDEGVPQPQNYRFMKEVDIMLVTPLSDGFNLVALEYILSQSFKNKEERGLLVLGNCGAAYVLKNKDFSRKDGFVHINPRSTRTASNKIIDAIENNYKISDKVIDYVKEKFAVKKWAQNNINSILESKNY